MSDLDPIAGPLSGVKVVEVAIFVFVPSAGAVLADWGADVVKVEQPVVGDPTRGLEVAGVHPGSGGFTFQYDIANRGKRSITIDLTTDQGRDLFYEILADSDVLLTNLLEDSRRKLGIDVDDVRARAPHIIYGRGSGYGFRGPEAAKGGYDSLAFWGRTGIASAVAPRDAREVEISPPALGDVTSGAILAGGIAAALYQKSRTGTGAVVDISLMSAGMWALQAGIVASRQLGRPELRWLPREQANNPLVNNYRTFDDRFISLCMLQSWKYWTELCVALGVPEIATDERFLTAELRSANSQDLVALLDELFASEALDHWVAALQKQEGQWDVLRQAGELHDDPQSRANGYIQTVDYGGGREIALVSAPVQFDGRPGRMGPAPELGAHTETFLLERGVTWDRIELLKSQGAIG